MGLIMDVHGAAEGYEAVALPLLLEEPSGTHGLDGAVLRRRSARPDQAGSDLPALHERRFRARRPGQLVHRAGVPLLRRRPAPPGDPGRPAPRRITPEELGEYLACLDTAVRHVREADGIETVVLCAHDSGGDHRGAVVPRPAGQPDRGCAGPGQPVAAGWLVAGPDGGPPGDRAEPPHPAAARRGPPPGPARPGHQLPGPGAVPVRGLGRAGRHAADGSRCRSPGGQATIRLGAHVTWLQARRGPARPGAARRPGPQARVRRTRPAG